ncbi:MAG: DNA translocase FtsK 4TM domain-containing protein [Rhodospirillaceae bacterium]|nr:DNA translocase FtsK 4TM domain-containing protein [Rhodospirillaceae bacterium]
MVAEAGFLPEGAEVFLKRRTQEFLGTALLLFGLFLVACIVFYVPGDRSFSVAVDRPVAHPLGGLGATVADVLVQGLGASGFMLALVVLVWGARFLIHRPVSRFWLRLTTLPAATLAVSVALSLLPAQLLWPELPDLRLGGVVGQLIVGRLIAWVPPWGGLAATSLISAGATALAVPLAAVAFGLSVGDWMSLMRSGGKGLAVGGRAAWRVGVWGGRAGSKAAQAGYKKASAFTAKTPKRIEPRLVARPTSMPDEEPEDPPLILDRAAEPTLKAPKAEPLVAAKPAAPKKSEAKRQSRLALEEAGGDYRLPPLDILTLAKSGPVTKLDESALAENARLLESVLQEFGVKGQIVKVRPGPVVTLYELEPAPGIKSSRVIGLADDIARSMSALSVRVAVIPGRNVIGIELPNGSRETVYLRELLGTEAYDRSGGRLPLILGKDIGGAPVVVDLARMPHLLVAGTTGSGKSVAINTMILSLLYRLSPEHCRFIMVDPKMLELSVYDGIPHLLAPVVTDPKKAVVALKWAVREMENRYRSMSKLGVRNIDGYNARVEEAKAKGEMITRRVQTGFDADTGKPVFEDETLELAPLPYVVVVVDEMADLMLVAGKDIEWAIQRLAQMARAAGIHLIMATQRPSVDVITGTIKANFPTRISFQVTSKIDSRTILGEQGAEQLLGQGDMLYMAGGGRITRVHGPFVSDGEVEDVVRFLKAQGQPEYVEAVTEDPEEEAAFGAMSGEDGEGSGDALYDQAVALVIRERKCSTSFIQRHLQLGYNRAARLVERMEAEGLVSSANHVGKREVLTRPDAGDV